jgi:hypothetical protein
MAALTFSPEARAFGVEEAKRVLLVAPGAARTRLPGLRSVLGRALLTSVR